MHASNVALFVEEFEQLDDCPFGAVRDGDLVCVKMVGPVGVLKGEVAMELDPPEMEGVFLLSWGKVLLIGRIFERTDSCGQKRKRSQPMSIPGRVVRKSPTILPSLKRPIKIDSSSSDNTPGSRLFCQGQN